MSLTPDEQLEQLDQTTLGDPVTDQADQAAQSVDDPNVVTVHPPGSDEQLLDDLGDDADGVDEDELDEPVLESRIGHTIQVPENAVVIRPNGDTSQVTGGFYVVDVAGTYLIDGQELEVR